MLKMCSSRRSANITTSIYTRKRLSQVGTFLRNVPLMWREADNSPAEEDSRDGSESHPYL